jgi:UV DNA damage endonuclease
MSIGYACIVTEVPGLSLKSCTLKYANDEKLRHISLHNLWVLNDVIDYNIRNGILLFRISSDIIPFGSHPANRQEWWKDHSELLTSIGTKIRNSGMRVSMHPGQYTVLNSPDKSVVERAEMDLSYHVRFLDALGVDSSHKIILHIGGVYGDKEQSAVRFVQNCKRLPNIIKRRLVLENDEKCYNIADVLAIADEVSLPVIFDNLHHSMNVPTQAKLKPTAAMEASPDSPNSPVLTLLEPTGGMEMSSDSYAERFPDSIDSRAEASYAAHVPWIKLCRSTWKPHDGRQKIHYSQQMAGGKPGAHSLTIDVSEFMSFYYSIKALEVDIMLEVKDKNLSAIKCIQSVKQISNQLHYNS